MSVTGAEIARYFVRLLAAVEANQQYLDELDAVAADGDHGATFVLAWRAVVARHSAKNVDAGPGPILLQAAADFASVGGSIGPLWGTALLRAGKSVGDRSSIDVSVAAQALTAGLDGMRERGGAEVGDKTLLDALVPAVSAFNAAAAAGVAPASALSAAIEAAHHGALGTRALATRRGRARRLSERSLGQIDPGAGSAYLAWATAGAMAGLPVDTNLASSLSAVAIERGGS
jgi:phosphoenolpyruvate---glycerone phosphotransferase subunit DhaL